MERFKDAAVRPCTLVMDNLSFHVSKETKEFCFANQIEIVYNGIYSSQYMPIERLWMFAKLYWRKEVVNISDFNNKTALRSRIEACIH